MTGMVDAATILTSAGVAAGVTLVIEYAAKPRLEARKDRIVAESRRARSVVDGVARAQLLLVQLAGADADLRWAGPDSALAKEIAPRRTAAFAAVREAGQELVVATLGVDGRHLPELLLRFAQQLGVDMVGMADWELVRIEWYRKGRGYDVVVAALHEFETPRWRRRSKKSRERRRLIEEHLAIAKTNAEAVPPPPG